MGYMEIPRFSHQDEHIHSSSSELMAGASILSLIMTGHFFCPHAISVDDHIDELLVILKLSFATGLAGFTSLRDQPPPHSISHRVHLVLNGKQT